MGCTDCSLYSKSRSGRIDGIGSTPNRVMIIGKAPTTQDNMRGILSIGEEEKVFNDTLVKAGLITTNVYITNAVKCCPPLNRTLEKSEIKCCKEFLVEEIRNVSPELIITLGNEALFSVMKVTGITKNRGTILDYIDGDFTCKVMPTLHPKALLYDETLKAKFLLDLQKAKSILAGEDISSSSTDINYNIVKSMKDFCKLHKLLTDNNKWTYDIETTSLDYMTGVIAGIGFSTAYQNWFLPLLNDKVLEKSNLRKDVAADWIVWEADIFKNIIEKLKVLFGIEGKIRIAHNGKFDAKYTKYCLDITATPSDDTMIQHYLFNENDLHGLKKLSADILGRGGYDDEYKVEVERAKKEKKSRLNISQEITGKYCCMDTDCTLQLFDRFNKEMQGKSFEGIYHTSSMPVLEVLTYMELVGVQVSQEGLLKVSDLAETQIIALENNIYDVVGKQFNIGSPQQLSSILVNDLEFNISEKTAKGAIQVDEAVLSRLHAEAEDEKQKQFFKYLTSYRGLSKLKSTYADGILKVIRQDGRVHTEYGLTSDDETSSAKGTVTGRISSAKPNLQNIPRSDTPFGKEIRNCFIPAVGCKFLELDFSQIELRIIALISQCKSLLHAYEVGDDAHSLTASLHFKKPIGEITKEERTFAKGINFGSAYGGQNEHTETFFAMYPEIKAFQNRTIQRVTKDCEVTTLFGRVRRLPAVRDTNMYIRSKAQRQAINFLIQSVAGEAHSIATIRVFEMLCRDYTDLRSLDYRNILDWVSTVPKIVMTIHDSLMLEVPENIIEEVKEKTIYEMTRPIRGIDIKLEVDTKILDYWGGEV